MPQLYARTADVTVTLNFPPDTENADEKMVSFKGAKVSILLIYCI